ncbi:DUF6364 family protein [Microtetraspora fusca]|uniref:DUF6364 family protein n=1 Tax=Microtetraspora fusca TaxID=1997 RepID=UPI000836EF9B|nr:DUF6364 family protein [Microtetraspora fusca]
MERTRKITLSVEETVVEQARAAAEREGVSLSAWVTRTMRREALIAESAAVVAAEPRMRELIDEHRAANRRALSRALDGTT